METNINIKHYYSEHTKPYCVLGVLLSQKGIEIKEDMLSWLTPEYDVITVEQELPGKLYEYPAIDYAINLAKTTNEYCLYLHTKGAANSSSTQEKVRNMWKQEFITNKNYYVNKCIDHINDAVIVCPLTGQDKNTWFNGFFITPEAAKKTEKLISEHPRHYWESMYRKNDKVKIIGRIFNDIKDIKDNDNIGRLLKYIKETY